MGDKCEGYEVGKYFVQSNGIVRDKENDYLLIGRLEDIESLQKEVENLIWNLAGCSTYALGYDLDKGHDKAFARPALEDVKRAMLKAKTKDSHLKLAVDLIDGLLPETLS